MKSKVVIMTFLCGILFPSLAFSWGQTGHRVVGQIAQNHLTKKAQKELYKILGDSSLSECSNWMDDIKSDNQYNYMYTWHYINIDSGHTYESMEKNPDGDAVEAIDRMIKILETDNASIAEKSFAIKVLVHLIGDLHQPFHVGRKSDLGGNRVKVEWFRRGTNIHRVWDSDMIDSKQLSFSEIVDEIDDASKDEVKQWQSTQAKDWMMESHEIVTELYQTQDLLFESTYKYRYQYYPVVEQRLLKAGVRLAGVLNKTLG